LEDNHDDLVKTLIIGCFVPLVLYSLWIFAVQGLISKMGDNGLISIANAQNPNTSLIKAIAQTSGYSLLIWVSKVFISISAVTSFLGVGLCLVDFIKDMVDYITYQYLTSLTNSHGHLNLFTNISRNILIYTLSFAPPLIIVLFNPGVFIKALSYAGILVLIFLVFLPLLMLYSGRYRLKYIGRVFLPGGQFFLVTLLLITVAILGFTIVKLYVY
jgi:tyrosine-specific transport protein